MNARSLVAIILAGLLACFAGPSAAAPAWELGFKGGVGLGKLSGDTGFGATFKLDYIELPLLAVGSFPAGNAACPERRFCCFALARVARALP